MQATGTVSCGDCKNEVGTDTPDDSILVLFLSLPVRLIFVDLLPAHLSVALNPHELAITSS